MTRSAAFFTGRRTRLVRGHEATYRRVHSHLPDAVAVALRGSGLLSWRIWEDGATLFHVIETREEYAAMVERIESLGAIDPDWDELIATLLDPSPDSDVLLPLVWGMDADTQWGNQLAEVLP